MTALTTQSVKETTAPRPRFGWLITDSISVSRRHLLKITRVPESLFFALIQPVMFVLLFAFVFGGAIDVGPNGAQSYREYLIPGIARYFPN
jgi:ABC-2 type transport system permease protein/oleandomycin transport system permease protein